MKIKSFKIVFRSFVCCLFILSLAILAGGFQPAWENDGAETLKQEIVKLKYVDAQTIHALLIPYYGPQTKVSNHPKLNNVLTIHDTPENLEKILEAIRKIDVKPKDLVFSIQAIIASDSDERTDPELKNDPLIRELQRLLKYKGYKQFDATMVRTTDRADSLTTFGPDSQFEISLKPEVSEDPQKGSIKLNLQLRQIKTRVINVKTREAGWVKADPETLIKTSLNLKPGERTVVGISRLAEGTFKEEENKGIILLIAAAIVN